MSFRRLITNASVLTREEIVTGTVEIVDGCFSDVQPGRSHLAEADDWEGDFLFPGLIELHNHLSYDALPLWDVPKRFSNRATRPPVSRIFCLPV